MMSDDTVPGEPSTTSGTSSNNEILEASGEILGSHTGFGQSNNVVGDSIDEGSLIGSLSDIYLASGTGDGESSDTSSLHSSVGHMMSEKFQGIAANVYHEFEQIVDVYGIPLVERLMPHVVNMLENLDEMYKEQTLLQTKLAKLKEDRDHLISELENEKRLRKQSQAVSF
ncbi:unnamed protein product [Protopolystoma xenopodis]|uniref:RH1 domain-containing protein n=1 Tax=Protopolystoma xenopodis TaxID=117903 RepID=A0A448XNP6_9PLAT|nr:unnamed protein product [Protopolystoma xenopodis]